jgi:hypothetical protein
MLLSIKPKINASKRTRERIFQHGPIFRVERKKPGMKLFEGRSATLFSSEKTEWFGWIPDDEWEEFVRS